MLSILAVFILGGVLEININRLNNIFEFEYFNWTYFDRLIFKKIYQKIEKTSFARQDLFQSLYQQIFLTLTRHKIGEFYTFPNLVNKMVNNFYEFGLKILDPSCGSGSFLIDIVISIINSKNPDSLKIDAINKVYILDDVTGLLGEIQDTVTKDLTP